MAKAALSHTHTPFGLILIDRISSHLPWQIVGWKIAL